MTQGIVNEQNGVSLLSVHLLVYSRDHSWNSSLVMYDFLFECLKTWKWLEFVFSFLKITECLVLTVNKGLRFSRVALQQKSMLKPSFTDMPLCERNSSLRAVYKKMPVTSA